MTSIAIAIAIRETNELAPSEIATEPPIHTAEPKPSADAAALRSTLTHASKRGDSHLARFVALNNQLDAAAAQGRAQWGRFMTQGEINEAVAAKFRKPQHDLDASKRGKLGRFWTWCACGHVYTVPGECVHCVGSGIQKPETD